MSASRAAALAIECLLRGIAGLAGLVAFAQQLAPQPLQVVALGFGRRCPRHGLCSLLDGAGSLGLRARRRIDRAVTFRLGLALPLDCAVALTVCVLRTEKRRLRVLPGRPLRWVLEDAIDKPLASIDRLVFPS